MKIYVIRSFVKTKRLSILNEFLKGQRNYVTAVFANFFFFAEDSGMMALVVAVRNALPGYFAMK